ncbi:MAG: sugar ABC transporter substrate-binding protein, partial [Paraburkholderia graminis]
MSNRIRRRIVAAAILATASTALPFSAAYAQTAPAHKPKVALVMKSLANEFFKTMEDGARKHQAAHAGDYELVATGIKDEQDVA